MSSTKGLHVVAACMLVAGAGLVSSAAQAADPNIEELRTLIEAQQRQIDALKSALDNTRRDVDTVAVKADAAAGGASSKVGSFLETVKIGGVAELEATNSRTFAGADSSDITLAKVNLFVDTQPHEYLATHVQFLYEDKGSENITLDEANFTLGNAEKFPLYLIGGKWAMPFGGGFETNMGTDPLTKSLGETKEAALLVGAAKDGAMIEGYVYNGDSQQSGEGNNIDQFGVSVGYGAEANGVSYNAGIGYINNIADSNGLTEALGTNARSLADYRAGAELHGDIGYEGTVVRASYMSALSSFAASELAFKGQGAKPVAWGVEAAHTTSIMGKETTFAGTVQGTKEARAIGYPELRLGGAITVAVVEHFSIVGEYLHDEDYGTSDGGTGKNGHTAKLKFVADF